MDNLRRLMIDCVFALQSREAVVQVEIRITAHVIEGQGSNSTLDFLATASILSRPCNELVQLINVAD